MKNKFLVKMGNSISTGYSKVKFQTIKHSPELLLIAGIGTGIVAAGLACKATLKVQKVREESKKTLTEIDEELQKGDEETYSKDDAKKDAVIVYTQTAVKYVRAYAPSIVMGLMSVACLTYSNRILQKRLFATAAAYATLDRSFGEYRKRVAERVGEEEENKIFHGIRAITLEEPVLNKKGEETGKTKKTTIEVADGHGSPYSKEFDHTCNGWNNGNPEYMDFFLRSQEHIANTILKARGYLFLNEVYKMLGMEPTVAGQSVGWIMATDDDDHIGDNRVRFDRYMAKKLIKRDGKDLYENVHMIDFNVDGNILEKTPLTEF